jgi:hypothetical protein
MPVKRHWLLFLIAPLLAGNSSHPRDCGDVLEQLEGWTVLKVTTVNGNFEGCDFDRLLELSDGTILRCNSYGYQYAYMPQAALFGQSVTLNGQAATMLRLVVEDEVYDVRYVRPR